MSTLRPSAPPPGFLHDWLSPMRHRSAQRAWEKSGRAGPAPHLHRRDLILETARRFGIKIFVETGTGDGDMVRDLRDHFRELYTLEHSDELYERARKKFDPWPHIHCLNGHSPELLTSILRRISQPCLFRLAGHGPGGSVSRLWAELDAIGAHHVKRQVILVEHAAALADGLEQSRAAHWPSATLAVEHDVARLLPASA